jgi:hypothetical protein
MHHLCNMFVFACPIIAKSQCWLLQISVFALKYPYLSSYICICTRIQLPVSAQWSQKLYAILDCVQYRRVLHSNFWTISSYLWTILECVQYWRVLHPNFSIPTSTGRYLLNDIVMIMKPYCTAFNTDEYCTLTCEQYRHDYRMVYWCSTLIHPFQTCIVLSLDMLREKIQHRLDSSFE